MKFIDLHTHTFFSDGVLSPSELVYRYKISGCTAVALTDHADYSNIGSIIESMNNAAPKLREYYGLEVIPGVELTYVPPLDLENMVKIARETGAEIVVVHGETTAENVPPGTNLAACRAKCDILAHPGHLTEEVASVARDNDVRIELTTRNGHRATNDEVYEVASKAGCKIVMDTDSHFPEDLLDRKKVLSVLGQCGLEEIKYNEFRDNSQELVDLIIRRRK